MPIFKASHKLLFYAHVPKCGGSSVSWYLRERFGDVAFNDSKHTSHAAGSLWSQTSPQHIDCQSLDRLFPEGFFDAVFTIVRHPVPRLISAFHFQRDVEKIVPMGTTFSDWLEDITELRQENVFAFDNHMRPMSDIVPEGAQVFYMEHGLDGMIPWLDTILGDQGGPRAIPKINAQGAYGGASAQKAKPTERDLKRIAEIYSVDFKRFGYDLIDTRSTSAPAPVLDPEFLAQRDIALKAHKNPLNRIKSKIKARLAG